jgi:hypothetical protein
MNTEHLEMSIEWWLEKREYPDAPNFDIVYLGHNEMTTVGLQYLLDVMRGTVTQPLNAASAQVGVGSSSTAFSLAQTDLTAALSAGPTGSAYTNATPIVVTTGVHGLATGASVTITGVGGNTAANGSWSITVLSTTTFSLNGSVGNGTYTSGGTIQTGNRTRRPMEATYPSRTTNTLNFQGSFGALEANYVWAEWGLFCAAPSNVLVSRRVQALGTKVNPNVWTLTAHLALA